MVGIRTFHEVLETVWGFLYPANIHALKRLDVGNVVL
jgi:hypothetical protein